MWHPVIHNPVVKLELNIELIVRELAGFSGGVSDYAVYYVADDALNLCLDESGDYIVFDLADTLYAEEGAMVSGYVAVVPL